MDLDVIFVCLIEWYQGISVEVLPNSSHHIRHSYHHILTVALEQQACMFKLYPASVHVCSTCTRPSAQSSLPKGQQSYLTLRMFDYVAQDKQVCLKPSSFFCNSFATLAGPLQRICLLKLCY